MMAAQIIAIVSANGSEINLLVKLINNDDSCEQWLVFGIISSPSGFRMVKLNIMICNVGVERLAI